MRIIKQIILYLFITLFVMACSDSGVSPLINQRGQLISTNFLFEYSQEQLNNLATSYKFDIKAVSSVKAYEIIYYTETSSKSLIKASGLLLVPQIQEAKNIVSVQHITAFQKNEGVMSKLIILSNQGLMPTYFGNIVMMADYIGYGASEEYFHPYHSYRNTVNACIDMIFASKQALSNMDVTYNDSLSLIGYSEGAYASVATQKEIEQKYSDKLTLKSIIAGDGAYDLSQIADIYFNSDTLSEPTYIPLLINSYLNESNDQRKIESFFKPELKESILKIVSGQFPKENFIGKLPNHPNDLLDSLFLYNFINRNERENNFRNYLINNSLINFNPKTPMLLFQGKYDKVVPILIAEAAYNFYSKNNTNVVLKVDESDISHDAYFFKYIDEAIKYFKYH